MTLLAVVLAVVLQLVVFHTLDGRNMHVNPATIVMVGEARDANDPHKKVTGEVRCVIYLLDGRVLTVVEDCASVRQRLEEAGR